MTLTVRFSPPDLFATNDLSLEKIGVTRPHHFKKNVDVISHSQQRCIGNLSLAARAVCKSARRWGHDSLKGDVTRRLPYRLHETQTTVLRRQRIWNSWKHLCSTGCGYYFVDMRKLKLRSTPQHACRPQPLRSCTHAWPSVCVVPLDNLCLTDIKSPCSKCYAKPRWWLVCLTRWQLIGVYSADLLRRKPVAVKEKHRRKLPKYPYFCMTVHLLTSIVLKWVFEEIHHPSHYHDKTSSDYYLFPNLKRNLPGQNFLLIIKCETELKTPTLL